MNGEPIQRSALEERLIRALRQQADPIRSPDRRDDGLNPDMQPAGKLKPAAVLVPLVLRPAGPTILLTRRTDHLYDHAGQISFPGGRLDPGDASPEAAALRETQEEVGLPPDRIELIGRLDTYVILRTGYEVTPTVGLVRPPFEINPDPFEVAEVFEVPLSFVADPGNHERHSRQFNGVERWFYVLQYEDYYIWGATAAMLVNLSNLLGAQP